MWKDAGQVYNKKGQVAGTGSEDKTKNERSLIWNGRGSRYTLRFRGQSN